MKQLAMLFAVGAVAFTLTACGEEQPKQPQVNQNETTVMQPAEDQTKPEQKNENGVNTENGAKPADDASSTESNQY